MVQWPRKDRAEVANIGAYACIALCGSFQGSEVFLVDLNWLRKYVEMKPAHNGELYVVVPLLGHFTNDQGQILKSDDIEEGVFELIQQVQSLHPSLIPSEVNVL
jgi:hypothetical protein